MDHGFNYLNINEQMKKNNIYLSIVLSTYNEEKYIAKSIQSILDQSYPYFEFIIVNDGSTDNTLQIIKSFVDSRIVIIDKPNTGLPDSLNEGIKAAKYDWIARMDGDDIAAPNRFETQVQYIDDSVGVIGGQFKTIDENDKLSITSISSKPLKYSTCKWWLLLGMSPLAHPTVLIRKSCLLEHGGYDANFRAAQDMELWSRLSPDVKIINIPESVLFYRKHSNNISNKRKQLQMQLTFLGYLKYVLQIRRPLSSDEFIKFKNYFANNGLIQQNESLFYWSHNGRGLLRKINIIIYYLWRLQLIIRYRICISTTTNRIFS